MKNNIPRLTALLAGLFAFSAAPAFSQIWNFDTDAQGWTLFDAVGSGNYSSLGSGSLTWHATGGNPGGFVSGLDPSAGSFMFQAPITGVNYSSFIGGKLNFALETDQTPDFSDDSVIVFKGGAGGLTIVSALGSQPGVSWTNYSLNLNASAFRLDNLGGAVVTTAQFADVMGALNVFLINGEFHNGVSETTGLDSVEFIAPSTAVPEPSVYGIVGAGLLAGLIAWRRKSRAIEALS